MAYEYKSNIPNTLLYVRTKLEDYDAQVTLPNTSGSLRIHVLVVSSFALASHKVSPTKTIVKKILEARGRLFKESHSTQT
jgi:hypothetical protein